MAYVGTQTDTAAQDGGQTACSGASSTTDTSAVTSQLQENGTAGSSEQTLKNSAGQTGIAGTFFQTAPGEPGASTWDSGDWVIRLDVTTANTNITLQEIHICEFTPSGTNQGSVTSLTGIGDTLSSGVHSHTVTQGSDYTPAGSDSEVYIVLVYDFGGSHGNEQAGITPSQNIDTPITTSSTVSLAGTGSGSASGSGTLSARKKLAGTGSGAGSGVAALSARKGLSGTGVGSGSGIAALAKRVGLLGTGSGVASADATLSPRKGLAGTGSGLASGDATLSTGDIVQLVATGKGLASADAVLSARKALVAAGTGTSTGDATLSTGGDVSQSDVDTCHTEIMTKMGVSNLARQKAKTLKDGDLGSNSLNNSADTLWTEINQKVGCSQTAVSEIKTIKDNY